MKLPKRAVHIGIGIVGIIVALGLYSGYRAASITPEWCVGTFTDGVRHPVLHVNRNMTGAMIYTDRDGNYQGGEKIEGMMVEGDQLAFTCGGSYYLVTRSVKGDVLLYRLVPPAPYDADGKPSLSNEPPVNLHRLMQRYKP